MPQYIKLEQIIKFLVGSGSGSPFIYVPMYIHEHSHGHTGQLLKYSENVKLTTLETLQCIVGLSHVT